MSEPVVIGWKAMTEGFFGADDRLHRALADWRDPAGAFIPLFETLNWLVAVVDRLRDEGQTFNERTEDLLRAIRYARGRVHHQWAEAFELRDDVRFDPVWLGVASTQSGLSSVVYDPPETFTDWCWRDAAELPPADRPRYQHGLSDYAEHLAGKPVRRAIGHVRDGLITPLWIASGGERWPPA